MQSFRRHRWPLLWIALAAVPAYLPLLWQPLLEDDYPNILQARLYGPPAHWGTMFGDPIHRFRATTWVLTNALDQIAGPRAIPFHVLSVLLHIANAWLLYGLARTWRLIGTPAAFAAAVFFALQEGHQEAIMWYSACNELLQALFGLACVLCWVRFWEQDRSAAKGWGWYALSLGSFAFALASKESAVILPALLLLFVSLTEKKTWAFWLPFALLSVADILLILQARTYSFRFHDGSFELSAPFWITLPLSLSRLLWPWGFAAIAALFVWAKPAARRITTITLAWMILTLLPYSFLTYMHRVPSRQTYLASAGLALLVGVGFAACAESFQARSRRAWITAIVALVVIVNVGTLWTRKRQQFLERAAPTEALARYAQTTAGPVVVRCFPGPPIIAEAVLPLRAGRPVTDLIWQVGQAQGEGGGGGFCWTDKGAPH